MAEGRYSQADIGKTSDEISMMYDSNVCDTLDDPFTQHLRDIQEKELLLATGTVKTEMILV